MNRSKHFSQSKHQYPWILFWLLVTVLLASVEAQQTSESKLEQYFDSRQQKIVLAWEKKDYGTALAILDSVYALPDVSEASQVWITVLYELTCAHTLLGHREEALGHFRELFDAGYADYEQIQRDTDLDSIRSAPLFQQIARSMASRRQFWDNPFFGTPYKENISDDEKLAGLSKFWSECKYNFVYFDKLPDLNWDSIYFAYLPQIRQTRNTMEYFKVLQRFGAELKDGHTRVEAPNELLDELYDRPAIDTRLVEDKVVITNVVDRELSKAGLKPGLEVVAIDGVPVKEYAEKQVEPYNGESTEQGREQLVYSFYLLCGAKSTPVKLTLKDGNTKQFDVNLTRRWRSFVPAEAVKLQTLKDRIAYLQLRTFGDNRIVSVFDSLFDQINNARGLIIDLRENSGGNSDPAFTILSYFVDTTFTAVTVKQPEYAPWRRSQGLGTKWETTHWSQSANKTRQFKKPVVVLIGPATGSATEDFVAAFNSLKRGKTIGEPTAGSTGQPIWFSLPGGIVGQVCTNRTTFADGREYVGVGIHPDIVVRPTVADIRSGRDPVLEAALRCLK
jgi:carboxyl-terminal processing protease